MESPTPYFNVQEAFKQLCPDGGIPVIANKSSGDVIIIKPDPKSPPVWGDLQHIIVQDRVGTIAENLTTQERVGIVEAIIGDQEFRKYLQTYMDPRIRDVFDGVNAETTTRGNLLDALSTMVSVAAHRYLGDQMSRRNEIIKDNQLGEMSVVMELPLVITLPPMQPVRGKKIGPRSIRELEQRLEQKIAENFKNLKNVVGGKTEAVDPIEVWKGRLSLQEQESLTARAAAEHARYAEQAAKNTATKAQVSRMRRDKWKSSNADMSVNRLKRLDTMNQEIAYEHDLTDRIYVSARFARNEGNPHSEREEAWKTALDTVTEKTIIKSAVWAYKRRPTQQLASLADDGIGDGVVVDYRFLEKYSPGLKELIDMQLINPVTAFATAYYPEELSREQVIGLAKIFPPWAPDQEFADYKRQALLSAAAITGKTERETQGLVLAVLDILYISDSLRRQYTSNDALPVMVSHFESDRPHEVFSSRKSKMLPDRWKEAADKWGDSPLFLSDLIKVAVAAQRIVYMCAYDGKEGQVDNEDKMALKDLYSREPYYSDWWRYMKETEDGYRRGVEETLFFALLAARNFQDTYAEISMEAQYRIERDLVDCVLLSRRNLQRATLGDIAFFIRDGVKNLRSGEERRDLLQRFKEKWPGVAEKKPELFDFRTIEERQAAAERARRVTTQQPLGKWNMRAEAERQRIAAEEAQRRSTEEQTRIAEERKRQEDVKRVEAEGRRDVLTKLELLKSLHLDTTLGEINRDFWGNLGTLKTSGPTFFWTSASPYDWVASLPSTSHTDAHGKISITLSYEIERPVIDIEPMTERKLVKGPIWGSSGPSGAMVMQGGSESWEDVTIGWRIVGSHIDQNPEKRYELGTSLEYSLSKGEYELIVLGKKLTFPGAQVRIPEILDFIDKTFLDFAMNPSVPDLKLREAVDREKALVRAKIGNKYDIGGSLTSEFNVSEMNFMEKP